MSNTDLRETLEVIGRTPDMFRRDTPLLLKTLDGLKGITKMTTHTIANMKGEGTDSRVFFRRPEDDSIYAILDPARIRHLKRRRALDKFLTQQRQSGVVIKVTEA